MVTVQSILLTPWKVKLQAFEYGRPWWNPFLDEQLAQKQPPEMFLKISQNSQEKTCARISF